MPKNITKNTFDPNNNRVKVNFSRLRPVLDFELNEAQDILSHFTERSWLFTRGPGPIGDGLLVDPGTTANTLVVRSGYLSLSSGKFLNVPGDVVVTGLTTPGANRTDYVYIEYFTDELDAAEEPDLLDNTVLNNLTALPFGETATRDFISYEIKVSEGSVPVAPAVGKHIYLLATLSRPNGGATIQLSEITDNRRKWSQSFVRDGVKVRKDSVTPLQANWDAGQVVVFGTPFTVTAGNAAVPSGGTLYIWVDAVGAVQSGLALPHWIHTPIAKVVADFTQITEVVDLRLFAPSAGGGGGSSNATQIELTTLDNLAVGDPVYLVASNQVAKADSTNPNKTPAIGVAINAVGAGNLAEILIAGELENALWSWTVGGVIYLGPTGTLTQTRPTAEGHVVQRVGVASDTDKVLFSFDSDRIIVGANPNGVSYGEKFYFYGNPVADDLFWLERSDVNNDSGDLRLHIEGDADGSEKFSIWSGSEGPGTGMKHEFDSAGNVKHTGNADLGSANQNILRKKSYEVELDTRSIDYVYDGNGRLSTVTEKDGVTTLRTIAFTYTGANTYADSSIETVDGKTITKTFSYDGNGNLIGMTKSVV